MPTVQGFNTTSGVLKYNAESLDNYNTPLFDSTSTYEVGDYVIENGKLYRCITDVSTAGDWSSVSSNFVAAILTDDIKNIKGNVSELTTDVSTLENDVETLGDNVETLSTDVQTLSTNVNNLGTSVNKINNSIAPMFSATTSYNSGDYVVYGGSLYRFTSDHTAGAWTGIDAVQVKLTEDMVFIPGTGEGSATMREDSASGQYSFAQGQGSDASGLASSAFGNNTSANGRAQFVIGQANIEDTEDASSYGAGAKKHIFIVGNGLDASNRSNAFALDWDGNVELSSGITLDKGKDTEFKLSGGSMESAFPHDRASGSIASFIDGANEIPMKSVLCDINPSQDLHGYDAPWPAGGRKNKLPLPADQTVNGVTLTRNADGTITLTGTSSAITYFDFDTDFDSTLYAGYVLSGYPDGFVGNQSTVVFRISASASDRVALQDITSSSNNPTIDNNGQHLCLALRIANNYAFPSGGLTFSPMLRASSESAGFEPYANLCPLSGFTGLMVTRTGKNLLNTKDGISSISSAEITATRNSDGSYNATGTANGTVNLWLKGKYSATNEIFRLLKGVTYYLHDITCWAGGANITPNANIGESKTYTPTEDKVVTGIRATTPNGTALNTTIYPYIGTTPYDSWIPYNGEVYPVSWQSEAGTVYGGTLDVLTGVLTVTHGIVDLGSLTWAYSSGGQGLFYSNGIAFLAKKPASNAVKADVICSSYPTVTANDIYGGSLGVGLNTTPQIWYRDGIHASEDLVAGHASWLEGVQLCYELAAPQTYQLTPTEVDSLLGANNLWHDANGNIEVNYYADTTLFINKKIAAAIASLS